MKAIGLYLRPLSDFHTGTQPYIGKKAENIDKIEIQAPGLTLHQQSEIEVQVLDEITNHTVPNSNRHWWAFIPDDWFKQLNKPLRHHGDITDFITALNICTNAPIAFSQEPGRTVEGYHEVDEQGIFHYKDDLSAGGLGIQAAFTTEVPNHVTVSDCMPHIYQSVRNIRESGVASDTQADLRIALHMYDDALTGTRWTSLANFFYVCENVLCSGYQTYPEDRIAEETELDSTEAETWGSMVNRLKHPDEPSESDAPPTTLLEMIDDDAKVPPIAKMRCAANTALADRLENWE